jgi:hypothetical protein
MATDIKKNVIVLAGIAVALVAGIGIIMFLFSGPAPSAIPVSDSTDTTPTIDGQGFDLKVLQRSGYKALDQRPVQDGLLPVKPPQLPGKANPFL